MKWKSEACIKHEFPLNISRHIQMPTLNKHIDYENIFDEMYETGYKI